MRSGPITIDGITGPILVDTKFWNGRQLVTVDGVPVPTSGRRRFPLPTADGATVDARVTSSLVSPHPTIEIAGVKHEMGPALPIALKVLILLPAVLLLGGGAIGGLIAAMAILANARIAASTKGTAVQAFAMVGVLLAAALVRLQVAVVLVGSS